MKITVKKEIYSSDFKEIAPDETIYVTNNCADELLRVIDRNRFEPIIETSLFKIEYELNNVLEKYVVLGEVFRENEITNMQKQTMVKISKGEG